MSKYSREEIGEMNLDDIARKAKSIEEAQSMLKQYMGPLIEKMMEAEMEDHLGYEKHSVKGNNSGNSRNGTYKKTILTSSGEEKIEVPR
ncbi:MAG: IS256 family transposase, partial [Candidatus Gracilibacteria bacterium]|nr:IS256 family transposase [Candidatus Gracilibacteria bacterium]